MATARRWHSPTSALRKFTNAHATAGGHTGAINDSQLEVEAIALEPSSSSLFGGGNGGFFGDGYGYNDYRLLLG